jgi:hypothetical protein
MAPSHTAAALGISSCATAGFSLFEAIERNSDRESIASSESNDQQQLNNLNSNPSASPTPAATSWNTVRQFQRFLASLEIAEKIGQWIPDPLGTCAYASTGSAETGLSVCQSARASQSNFLSCAKAGDPLLAQAFNRMGGEDQFFSTLEQNMGMSRSVFLNADHVPTPEQIVGLMTVRAPQYRPGLNAIATAVGSQLAAHRGNRQPRLLAQQLEAPQPGAAGLLQASTPNESQAGSLPLATTLRAPAAAIVDNESGDLFSRVSLRYQVDRERLDQLEWSTPYNRFSTR